MHRDTHSALVVRADFDLLAQLAARFAREAEAARSARLLLSDACDTLRAGDWVGRGAAAFYAEMDAQVLPSLARLADALDASERAALNIRARMQVAEREAAAILSESHDPRPPTVIVPVGPVVMSDRPVRTPSAPYRPAWLEPARLAVSLSPRMSTPELAAFESALRSTPLGAELLARDPALMARLDVRVLPDRSLRELGLIRGREGVSFPVRDGRYLIGVSALDMRQPADVAVLAHEVFHVWQREHATDPSRAADFTQLAMEREAYTFQNATVVALAGGAAAALPYAAELNALLAGDAQARHIILGRDALGVYAGAPPGRGGDLEQLGFSREAIRAGLGGLVAAP